MNLNNNQKSAKKQKISLYEEAIYTVINGIIGACIVFFIINVLLALGVLKSDIDGNIKTVILTFCVFFGAMVAGYYSWPKTSWIVGVLTAAFSVLPLGWLNVDSHPIFWQRLLPFSQAFRILPIFLFTGLISGIVAGFLGAHACKSLYPHNNEDKTQSEEKQAISPEDKQDKREVDIHLRMLGSFAMSGIAGTIGTVVGFVAFFLFMIIVLGIMGLHPSGEMSLAFVSGIGAIAAASLSVALTDKLTDLRSVTIILSGALTGLLFPLPIALISGMTYYRDYRSKPSNLLPFSKIPDYWPYFIAGGIAGALLVLIYIAATKKALNLNKTTKSHES